MGTNKMSRIGDFFKKAGSAIASFFKKVHMCKMFILVRMQIGDKIDLSWTKSIKTIIQKIVFAILKFALVFAITYVLLLAIVKLGIFYPSELVRVTTLIVTVIFVLSIVNCTIELMNTLYFDEDNKVLVTLPVNGATLFFSKLIVYYIDELKKAIFFTVPIFFACFFEASNYIEVGSYFWMIVPILFYVAIPVLIGAILSIPALFIKRLFLKAPWLELIAILTLLGLVIWGVVELILLIPTNINLIQQWASVKNGIHDTMLFAETYVAPIKQFVYMITGTPDPVFGACKLDIAVLYRFLAMVGIVGALIGLSFLITKPFFFYMMTKNFEFTKKVFDEGKANNARSEQAAFFIKEIRLMIRSFKQFSGHIITYIAIPIVILLLNRIFAAMEVNLYGEQFTYLFSLMLILLPLFATNSRIASIYSIEGRAAYIKKTKPVSIYWALICKLLFFFVASIPSVVISVIILDKYTPLSGAQCTYLAIGIIGLQYCIIFFNAILDIIHPQNEHFATVGNTVGSKNETVAMIVAVASSLIISFVTYLLLKESSNRHGGYTFACVEFMIIGCLCAAIGGYMFYSNVKAFYYEK